MSDQKEYISLWTINSQWTMLTILFAFVLQLNVPITSLETPEQILAQLGDMFLQMLQLHVLVSLLILNLFIWRKTLAHRRTERVCDEHRTKRFELRHLIAMIFNAGQYENVLAIVTQERDRARRAHDEEAQLASQTGTDSPNHTAILQAVQRANAAVDRYMKLWQELKGSHQRASA